VPLLHGGSSCCRRRPIPPGPFLRLAAAFCGYTPPLMPLLHCSRSFHCGFLPRDLLMLSSGLHLFWIWHLALGSHQLDWATVCQRETSREHLVTMGSI
jgi:hypothetical protein